MTTTNNPQIVKFCNEDIRRLAEEINDVISHARQVKLKYFGQGLSTLLGADTAAVIEDGSATDGRPPLTCNDAMTIVTRGMELVSDYEANGSAKLNTVIKAVVNSRY